jgi:hypothetical protein
MDTGLASINLLAAANETNDDGPVRMTIHA